MDFRSNITMVHFHILIILLETYLCGKECIGKLILQKEVVKVEIKILSCQFQALLIALKEKRQF